MLQRIVVIFSVTLIFSCGSKNEETTPKRTTLIESVYASVLVQPDSLYDVYSSVPGILDTQFVNEGDTIAKGQRLFQIFNKMPDLNQENAKLNLQHAQDELSGNAAVLDGLQKQLQTARLKCQNDSINFMRQKRLWDQHIGSEAEFEAKKLNYESSTNTLEQLQNQYQRTKNDLRNKVLQADNAYESAIVNSKDFIITSKIHGKVYAIYKKEGEIITVQQPLASVGSPDIFIVDLLVDEVDVVKLQKGQKALITLDAYVNKVFLGKITKIYPKKDERTQTFQVEAVFDEIPKVLYPGLAGEANIIVSEKENTLTIPLDYLMEGNKVQTDKGLKEVTVGRKNMEEVEILSGIDTNTKIYKPEQ